MATSFPFIADFLGGVFVFSWGLFDATRGYLGGTLGRKRDLIVLPLRCTFLKKGRILQLARACVGLIIRDLPLRDVSYRLTIGTRAGLIRTITIVLKNRVIRNRVNNVINGRSGILAQLGLARGLDLVYDCNINIQVVNKSIMGLGVSLSITI